MTLLARNEQSGARLTAADLGRGSRWVPSAAAVLDVSVVALALTLALLGRTLLFGDPALTVDPVTVAPLVLAAWATALLLQGSYAKDLFGAGTDEYKRVLTAGLVTAGLVGVAGYLTHADLSRGFFVILFAVGLPGMLLGRLGLRLSIHAARRRGALQRSVLLVGGPLYVDEIAAVLRRESWLGLAVVGALTPASSYAQTTSSGVPVLGDSSHVAAAVAEHDVDVVFFAPGAHTASVQLREVVWELEGRDVEIVVAPSMTDISGQRIRTRPVAGLPLIHVLPPTWTDATRWGKRTFDVLGALAAIVLTSPILVWAALWIKMHDGGPVLFKQTRIGRQGQEFSCWKFRSMVTDAESLLAQLHADAGSASVLFKMKEDPRITKPGRLLRRLSLDELPQLVNVLCGDMSLVGPRPPLPVEVSRYEGHTARRLHVRPGITGLWQVSGRSDLTWEEAIRLDLYYVDNWSMLQDLNILLKTVGAVLSSRGAY